MSGGFGNFGNNDCKVYVGNLPSDIKRRDLEDIFYKYGKVVEVDLHERRESPFAFIEFEDPKDAEDAVRYRDGYSFDGYKIRVEFPRSSSRGGRGGGRGNYDRRGYARSSRTKGYKVEITGLPGSGSWQDLKDHFRQAGDIIFADVRRDGVGIVEFARHEHAKRAVRDLDDSKFRSHEGETAYIRVAEPRDNSYDSPPRRSRSRSPRSPYSSSRRSRSRSN